MKFDSIASAVTHRLLSWQKLRASKLPAVFLGAGAVALFVAMAGAVSLSVANRDRVVMGVQYKGKSLAGLTKQGAQSFFEQDAKRELSQPAAVLSYNRHDWQIAPSDITLVADAKKAADAAYSIGHTGSFLQNTATQIRCALFGQSVDMGATYDAARLDGILAKVKSQIDKPPANAVITLDGKGGIHKKNAVTGLSVDMNPIKQDLGQKFVALQLTAKEDLTPEQAQPYVKDSDIANIDSVLGSYTTRFSPGVRGDNIGLAASKLNGHLILSGATLSFNDTVGKRTREAGYKNAGVIIDGEPAIDVGGGVCQVSSTLYNAVLLAGMKPTVRANHFLPSSYVPAGRDATVADGLLDFAFQNPLAHPVYLVVQNSGSAITISILGTRGDLQGKSISLVTEGARKNPTLYRIWTQNGQVIDREFMHTDSYT